MNVDSGAPPPGRNAIRRYLRALTDGAWRLVALTVGLTLAVAATEGLALALLFPLLEMAGVPGSVGVSSAYVHRATSRLHLASGGVAPLLLAIYTSVMIGRALLVRWSVISCTRLQEQFLLKCRRRLFRAVLASRWENVLVERSGSLTHALTAELEDAAEAPTHLLAIVTGTLISLVYLTVALRLSVVITLLASVAGIGLVLLLERRRREVRRAAQEVHAQTRELFAMAAEHVDALKTTKAFGAEAASERAVVGRSAAVTAANERRERLFADTRAMLDGGAVLLLALAIAVALSTTSLGASGILVLLYLFARLTPRLASLQAAYQRLMTAMPPFVRVADAIEAWEQAAEASARDETALHLRQTLVVHDVRYRYPADSPSPGATDRERKQASAAALRGATLTIAAGATTAVVGTSGAGKSTLADLVLGLLFPDSGRIEIDGIELTPARARSWRSNVGYVGQGTYLFNDTIRANFRWACPDVTDDEIRGALSLASADDFVSTLPAGIDSAIGEDGVRLSSGERQRIALARALVRRSELLILDEATNAVDAETERAIQQAVESLKGHMSVLVITHRLATVRAADVIYVMERGRVVEHGSFESLIARGGRFAALCEAQGITPTLKSQRLLRLS